MTRTADPFDELAAMFLTDRDREKPSPPPPPGPSSIELLVVGHLPVRAGLWLTPYAEAVARDGGGRTALVRLDGDEPMIQLLGDASQIIENARSLSEAIFDLADSVQSWIIRPSSRSEMPRLIRRNIDRLTILSSADQAALVNAYRLVKNLVECARQMRRRLPELGLAVIGADDEAAGEVAAKLNATTRSCLEVDVPLVRCLPRIDAALRSSSLRSFPGQERPSLEDVLSWIELARACPPPNEAGERPVIEVERPGNGRAREDAVRVHRNVRGKPGATLGRPAASPSLCPGLGEIPKPEDPGAALGGPAAPSVRSGLGNAPESRRTDEAALESAETTDAAGCRIELAEEISQGASDPSINRLKLTPKGSSEVEMRAPAQEVEPEEEGGPVPLAHHVEGLIAIVPRCPGHERVELALDAGGAIHLLAREDALRELPVIEAWAKAHRELLAMACPDQHFDPAGRTVCHLFTERPASLSDLHGGRVHLHVLAPVEVAGRRGWFAAPLNKVP